MERLKKKRTRIFAIAAAAILLCSGYFVFFVDAGGRVHVSVPPIFQSPPHGLDAISRGRIVYLQAWPTLPGRGVLVSVINDSNENFELDLRALCQLSGLEAFAVDTEGKEHKLEVSHFLPVFPTYRPVLGPASKVLISGFEEIVLQPKESFSWPVNIHHPSDRLQRAVVALPYTIDHFECVLSLEKGVQLRSNALDELRLRPTLTRHSGKKTPKKEFSQRLDVFRYGQRRDPGARLATLIGLCEMRRNLMLSEEQFAQVLAVSTDDACPLVRAHAAPYPSTWPRLLLDASRRVRREALKGAGGRLAHRQQINLTPILLGKIQDGDSPTKILALKALSKHTGGLIGRQFQDTIARAKNDSDTEVADTARQLFNYVEEWPGGVFVPRS